MRSLLVALLVVAVPAAAVGDKPRKPRTPRVEKARYNVTGTYTSNYDEVRLVQRGTLVEGEYVCCGGGSIVGRLDGKVIRFHWREGKDDAAWEGNGVWVIGEGGALRGTWGAGDSDDDGGEWNLDRMAEVVE
jgi:hypothetical protein